MNNEEMEIVAVGNDDEGEITPADALYVVGQIFDYAREAKITEREIVRYRTMRDIAITEITHRYQFAHAVLEKTFKERRRIIEKDFKIIDKGLENRDYALINQGLQHITMTIKDNPFKLFQVTTAAQRHKMLEDGELSIE